MTYALETQIENLRAEVNRLNNVIGERDWEIQQLRLGEVFAEKRGFEAARDAYDTAAKADCKVGGYIYKHETFDDYQRSKSQEGQA